MSVGSIARSSIRLPFSGPRRRGIGGANRAAALIGAAILVALYVGAVLAVRFGSADATHPDLINRLRPPGMAHPLGTDGLGRDVWRLLIKGAEWSIPMSILAMLLGAVVGIPAGVVAGWARGRVEASIMRVIDAAQAFPFIVLAIAVIAVLRPGFWPLVCTLAFGSSIAFARTSYLETRRVAGLTYVEASLSLGVRPSSVVVRHVLRNIRQSLFVVGAFTVADMCIAEAGLSYLGIGAPHGTVSWGVMLSDGQGYMQSAWWLVLAPSLAVMVVVLLCNFVGDQLDRH